MIRHEVRAGIFPTIGIGEMEKKNGININKWEISLSRFGIVIRIKKKGSMERFRIGKNIL